MFRTDLHPFQVPYREFVRCRRGLGGRVAENGGGRLSGTDVAVPGLGVGIVGRLEVLTHGMVC